MVNAPWITWTVYKVLKPWLDENTQSKVRFVKETTVELLEVYEMDHLLLELGGTYDPSKGDGGEFEEQEEEVAVAQTPVQAAAAAAAGEYKENVHTPQWEQEAGELAEEEEDMAMEPLPTGADARAGSSISMTEADIESVKHKAHKSSGVMDHKPLRLALASNTLPLSLEAFYYLFFSSKSTFMQSLIAQLKYNGACAVLSCLLSLSLSLSRLTSHVLWTVSHISCGLLQQQVAL